MERAPAPKALGLTPSRLPVLGSSRWADVSWGLGRSVTVLDDEARDGDDGGRGAAPGASAAGCRGAGGGDGSSSSSGFAIRSPPRACERLKSPFMVTAAGQRSGVTSGRVQA